MNTALKVGGYALGLLAVFGAAAGIGAAVTPSATGAVTAASAPQDHGSTMPSAPSDGAGEVPGGLMVSRDGYTLVLADRSVPAGAQTPLRLKILGPDGAPVTGYQTEHDKDLHLIVVRRDLSHFQHVHPVLDAEGTWTVPLDLAATGAGSTTGSYVPGTARSAPSTSPPS